MPGIKGMRRETIEDRHRISVKQLHRGGILREGVRGTLSWKNPLDVDCSIGLAYLHETLVLHYQTVRDDANGEQFRIVVPIEWTSCFYGGLRPWFHCPDCHSRCLFLYAHYSHYTCRHCVDLPYHSQGSTDYDRAAERANKIRKQLGWEDGFLNGLWFRPKGMHRKRFLNLVRQHNHYANLSLSLLPFPVTGFGIEAPYSEEDAIWMAGMPSSRIVQS